MMDSGLVQSLIVGMIVLAAGLFLARRAWRTISAARRPKSEAGCGAEGGCGCHVAASGQADDRAQTQRA